MRVLLLAALTLTPLLGADASCPVFSVEQRAAQHARIGLESAADSLVVRSTKRQSPAQAATRNNFIDDHIFSKLETAGIEPAPPTTDGEFLRRLMLDMTGRIPTTEQVDQFLADSNPNKRAALIESLIGTKPFVDHWTLFWGNRFQVTSGYYRLIGIHGRNYFHAYLRDFVARDRSYRDLASELIAATGDSQRSGPPNFIMRAIQDGDPIQDTWDTLTNAVTTIFLGVQTQCVSCHDGRGHLEEINQYLSRRRRDEFFQLSAFFARMDIFQVPVDIFNQQSRGIISDRAAGVYHGVVNSNNPGQRPPRLGAHEPTYMIDGRQPASGEWRRELARFLTEDRQFARAAVNYLWVHFFRRGIVDPPDAWDLSRIDANNPPRAPWTLQPSHPELLEALADEFISSGYNVRRMLRLMAGSAAYQLSSRYPGTWRPEYARFFAKQTPRRLSAEEIYDAMVVATMTETPMFVEGFAEPLIYAAELPDPTEPRRDGNITGFLTNFGRGDWVRSLRETQSSVVKVLYLMNSTQVNFRTFGNRDRQGGTRVARLAASSMSDAEAVKQLFVATLGRAPTDEEMAIVTRRRQTAREEWFSDIQWALLNKAEFLFNQ